MSARLPAEKRRRQLLDVAGPIFAEQGFAATTMDDIAGAAGVTKPVLYQHFPSKRALFSELLDDMGSELLNELATETSRAETGQERIELGFTAYFRFVVEHRPAFQLLFGATVRNDADFAGSVDLLVHQIADAVSLLIDVDVPDEQRRILSHALIGIAEATSRAVLTDPDTVPDPELLARWTSELAWYGLLGRRPGDPHDDAATTRA